MSYLLRLNQMKNQNYHELFPGVLTKGYRNAESVYIEDDLFVFLKPAIKNGYEPFECFHRFEIPKENWFRIISGFVLIREYLYNHQTTELTEYIQPHFQTLTESTLTKYLKNRVQIDEMIHDLITWIEEQLITNKCITLIGI
ncbi:hypothetical protein [Paenibacillus lutrae]|uniref:Uncharacterized protein n=1 Tax=Paenibacillus lutrae TaxID=2078573 RepID=A0A7X3FER4_9BACL|nr:hypothetical protein [Paenibacillus lutrae]MVO98141.1 hypothetical protein [Paenibacillus lutrae]